MKPILAALALMVTPAYAAEKTDQSPLLCDFFGILCPYEDEDDGEWGGDEGGDGRGGPGGAVDVRGGQGPVDNNEKAPEDG